MGSRHRAEHGRALRGAMTAHGASRPSFSPNPCASASRSSAGWPRTIPITSARIARSPGAASSRALRSAMARRACARSIRSHCCVLLRYRMMTAHAKINRESLLTLESLCAGAQSIPRPRAHPQARAHRAPGRAPDAHVRGRADAALPDPGDAAHREDVRGSGHPGRARCLQPPGARRQQFQGDDAQSSTRTSTSAGTRLPG